MVETEHGVVSDHLGLSQGVSEPPLHSQCLGAGSADVSPGILQGAVSDCYAQGVQQTPITQAMHGGRLGGCHSRYIAGGRSATAMHGVFSEPPSHRWVIAITRQCTPWESATPMVGGTTSKGWQSATPFSYRKHGAQDLAPTSNR